MWKLTLLGMFQERKVSNDLELIKEVQLAHFDVQTLYCWNLHYEVLQERNGGGGRSIQLKN